MWSWSMRVGEGSAVRAVLPVALLLAACACSGEPPPPTDGPPTAIPVDSLPTLTLEEELRVGSVDDADYGFSRIRGLHVDDGGRMYVFEGLDREIRVYDRDGRLLRRMGGAGEGPGEFRGSSVTFGVVGDTVWAMDWSFGAGGMLSLFDSTGAVLMSRAVEEVSLGPDNTGVFDVVVAPTQADSAGLLVGDLQSVVQLAADPDSLRVPRVHFTLSGEVVDTAGWYTRRLRFPESEYVDVGGGRYRIPRAGLDERLFIHLPDGRFRIERPVADSPERGVFRVTRVRFDGDTVYSRAYEYTPVRYPPDYLDQVAGRAARPGRITVFESGGSVTTMERPAEDSARAHAEILERLPFPDFQRPVGGERSFVPHDVGADGSLWLQRESAGLDEVPWTVLGPDGRPVGRITLPAANFSIRWADADRVWAVVPDDFDVPWLVRYRIRVPGP